jgi:hypothetical protein
LNAYRQYKKNFDYDILAKKKNIILVFLTFYEKKNFDNYRYITT